MARDVAAERHLATVAALDLAIALAAMAFSLVSLLAVAEVGRPAGLVSLLSLAVAFPHLVAGAALPSRHVAARWLQLCLGALSLPLLPIGTAWGAYVLRTVAGARGRALFETPSDAEPAKPFASLVALAVAGSLLVVLGTTVTVTVAGPAMARAQHRSEREHRRARPEKPLPAAPDAALR